MTPATPPGNSRAFRVALLACTLFTAASHATTFNVTTAADSGPGSLRQAILDANAQQVTGGTGCAPHDIVFAIPGNAPRTIQPLGALPPLQITIVLNAFTQPGASPNTLLQGSNAIPGIELDGSLAGASDGIVAAPAVPAGSCGGRGSVIRGFAINRFAGSAIASGADGCIPAQGCNTGGLRISGNYIGTDVTGLVALGNGAGLGRPAIRLGSFSSGNIIGEQIPADGGSSTPTPGNRNVISGNFAEGIVIASPVAGSQAPANRIRNNYIGLNASGTGLLPNGGGGVRSGVNCSDTQIHDNLISGNGGDGVAIVGNSSGAFLDGNGIGIGLGDAAFGNAGHGVYVSSSRGVGLGRRFLFSGFGQPSIAHNAQAGVFVEADAIVDVIALPIAANGALGIDLAPAGVNPNDDQDPDGGANEGLNTAVIDLAGTNSTTGISTIQGTINTTPNSSVEVFFFSSPACDASGSGEGQQVLPGNFGGPLFVNVTTNASGLGTFSVQPSALTLGSHITAVTRRFTTLPGPSALEVSEFSTCRRVVSTGPFIFADGFEGP